jgi:hypothetical protein
MKTRWKQENRTTQNIEEKCNRVRERVVGGGDAAVPDGLGVAAVVLTVWSDCVLWW